MLSIFRYGCMSNLYSWGPIRPAIPAGSPQQSDGEVGRAAGMTGLKKNWSVGRNGVDPLAMLFLKPSLRTRTITRNLMTYRTSAQWLGGAMMA